VTEVVEIALKVRDIMVMTAQAASTVKKLKIIENRPYYIVIVSVTAALYFWATVG
jgi:hypothetical protein